MPDSSSELELALPLTARKAARDFAAALTETPQFKAFEDATEQLHRDEAARQALDAYQSKQQSLQAVLMLNVASDADKDELQRLHAAVVSQPSVAAYAQAQTDLMGVCQSVADTLSQAVGLNYAAVCGSGCC